MGEEQNLYKTQPTAEEEKNIENKIKGKFKIKEIRLNNLILSALNKKQSDEDIMMRIHQVVYNSFMLEQKTKYEFEVLEKEYIYMCKKYKGLS